MLNVTLYEYKKPRKSRIRLRIPYMYRNPEYAKNLTLYLNNLKGIILIEPNIITARLLIVYDDSAITIPKIKAHLLLFDGNSDSVLMSDQHSSIPYHAMSKDEVIREFNSDANNGLSIRQVSERLKTHGFNSLFGQEQVSLIKLVKEALSGFSFKLLLSVSGISFLMGNIVDAISIVFIVAIEMGISVIQQYNAEKSLSLLKRLASPKTKVIRNGITFDIDTKLLVPGDIVLLESGNIVPADIRFISVNNLEAEESSLTGESIPVIKHIFPVDVNTPISDMGNMGFKGTTIIRGKGKGIVVTTGMNTQLGKIAGMLHDIRKVKTPVEKEIEIIVKKLTVLVIAASIGIIILGVIRKIRFNNMLPIGISLAVGAIPEGLPIIITISLAYSVSRMVKRNVIVRRLPHVEALGSTMVICTDKTGTLTTSDMKVNMVWCNKKHYFISNNKLVRKNNDVEFSKEPFLYDCFNIASCCNSATNNQISDPTDTALLNASKELNIFDKIISNTKKLSELPFDANRRRMTTVVDIKNSYMLYVKGAPECIIDLCNIPERQKVRLQKINEILTGKGARVLALAGKKLDSIPDKPENEENNLTFYGLIALENPLKSDIKPAVEKCKNNGIKVVMITGDHKNTAMAIGKKLGLDGLTITGNELESMSDDDLYDNIDKISIFARTLPHQKLKIIRAFKKKGYIVAMTGDGINDAPAIKEADIGISMGKSGTDVTREASSIILTDDNFTTILNAIEEGRTVNTNMKKFIKYVLSGNIAELLLITLSILLGYSTPLAAAQILWINLIIEGIPALALGMDPPDVNKVWKTKPENKNLIDLKTRKYIVKNGIKNGLISFLVYYFSLKTGNIYKAQTMAFSSHVVNQLMHIYGIEKENITRNKYINPSVGVSFMLLLFAIYHPYMMKFFKTHPLGLNDWSVIVLTSSLML